MEPLVASVASLFLLLLFLFTGSSAAGPSFVALSPYAPRAARCPSTPLVRRAYGLSTDESQYQGNRSAIASENLRSWVNTLMPNETSPITQMPIIGLASGGSGIRSLLTGAGVVQAIDNRDSVAGESLLAGLYQGITYHSGSSGGAWLLSALFGNDRATVTALKIDIWDSSFQSTFLQPRDVQGAQVYAQMSMDITSKQFAGYSPTLVDDWGRLLSYHLLYGDDAGVAKTMSGMANDLKFQNFEIPYPITTALGVDPSLGRFSCIYGDMAATQYEFHPYEFGSWDAGIRAFSQSAFMGSALDNGVPLSDNTCLSGFDNLGFLIGCSSNMFNYLCSEVPNTNVLSGEMGDTQNNIIAMTSVMHPLSFYDEYGTIPNPFYNWEGSTSPAENIYLVDGSQGGEGCPVWPLIQPERGLDLIIANDNSADTIDSFPNGTSLFKTYLRARQSGLTTMPPIPAPEEFFVRGLNKRPTFFGCFDEDVITIIYLPNTNYTFQSNIPTWKLQYSTADVTGMVGNGNMIATMGGEPAWPHCLACALLSSANSANSLPQDCRECLDLFCWREE